MSLIDMDEQKRLIISALAEFLESAKDDEEKGRIKSAITMYFKTLVESCDLLIYNQILKVPINHTDRFELLEKFFPDIYNKVSPLFKIYRKTYSQKVEKEDLEKVKNGTLALIKETEINAGLQELSKK